MYNNTAMEYHVFVEQHANNGYVAEIIGLANSQVVGKTEEEAITKAKETLAERLAHGKVVTIKMEPETPPENHPMLKGFGRFKDDPTFDDLMERIAEYRRQLDEEDAAE